MFSTLPRPSLSSPSGGSHSLPLSIIGIARNGRGKTFTPPSALLSSIRLEHARPRHARKQQKQQRPQGQMWISPRVSIMVGLTPESWGNECPPRVLIKPKVHLLLSPSYPPFLYACSHESHRRNGLAGRGQEEGAQCSSPSLYPLCLLGSKSACSEAAPRLGGISFYGPSIRFLLPPLGNFFQSKSPLGRAAICE